MNNTDRKSRREFLRMSAGLGAGVLLAGCTGGSVGTGGAGAPQQEADILPVEDLMREHGLLVRIALIYEECLRRLDAGGEAPLPSLSEAAGIVRRFVEDYHEKLEEEFVFPRFAGAGELAALAATLKAQHQAGRDVTDVVIRLSARKALAGDEPRQLQAAIRQFLRMYYPHLAREDTVLFPAFHDRVPPREYDQLGDRFEDRENQLFGDHGFEHMVEKVATIEKALGIYDLARFTPKA